MSLAVSRVAEKLACFESLRSCITPFSQIKARQFPSASQEKTYHLAPLVDSIGFAVDITRKKTERLDSIFDCPDESLQEVAIWVVRRTGETDNVALLIDRRGRIPIKSAKVAKVSHAAVFPKHGVRRGVSSNSLVADTRDAHNLTIIVDCRGSSGRIAGE